MYLKFSLLLCFVLLRANYARYVVRIPPDSKELTDEEWEIAMNHYEGEYKHMKFPIINAQFANLEPSEYCNDDYIKCLVSQQTPPEPACGYHRESHTWGKFRFPGYCDLYLDNCRRGMRYWKLLGFGLCWHPTTILWSLFGHKFDVIPSRRRGSSQRTLKTSRKAIVNKKKDHGKQEEKPW